VIVAAADRDLRLARIGIRAPITALWRKSNGVPATFLCSPVGISVASTGVYASALTMSR
jgi:hypothetical protein